MNIEWQLPYGSDSVNEFPTDAWHRFLKYSYCWRMESLKTLCHYWCRSRQRKQSHCRPWNHRRKLSHCRTRNHHWKLSDAWRMESTTKTNSWWTHEISWENRVIIDAWNNWWKPRHCWPEIVSENWVTLDLEIFIENWVTANVRNRQRKWIPDRRLTSIPKI